MPDSTNEVSVTLSDDEKAALNHEFSEPYGHEIRVGILGKLRAALAKEGDQEEGGVGLTDEERVFVLKRLKGDEYVTDTLAQKRADRTPIDQEYPGDEEAEARAAYRKAMPGVLADLDALCSAVTPLPALSGQGEAGK